MKLLLRIKNFWSRFVQNKPLHNKNTIIQFVFFVVWNYKQQKMLELNTLVI